MRNPLSTASKEPLANPAKGDGFSSGALTVQAARARAAASMVGATRMEILLSGGRVTLPQDPQVVARVAGHDPREGPDRHRLPARRPDLRPPGFPEAAQEGQVRLPDEGELIQELPERDPVRRSRRHVLVLVERRQGRRLAPAEAERPVAEDTLGVDEVPEHLPEAPLALGVSKGLPVWTHQRGCPPH